MQAHLLNGEVSCYMPLSGEELRKQVQVSCCHIHKQDICEYCVTNNNILQQNKEESHKIKQHTV